jgi:hypothetical protein
MALDVFDHPLYAQRKYFVQEIAGLDEVFDFLDEWPEEKRNLAYETMADLSRKAAIGSVLLMSSGKTFDASSSSRVSLPACKTLSPS